MADDDKTLNPEDQFQPKDDAQEVDEQYFSQIRKTDEKPDTKENSETEEIDTEMEE